MATIQLKRGQQANIGNVALLEGEMALAYNADKTAVILYVGTGSGKIVACDMASLLSQANTYTDTKITNLVNGAPATLDTLKELADAITNNETVIDAINSAITNKVDKVDGKGLSTNDYTTAEKTKLAGLSNYTHPNSGATAGTYKSVTANAQGHITAGTNPTTLAGYGITDAISASSTIDGGTF